MNVYKQLGYANGTPEARQLADRLSAWHDAMVAHERRADSSCSDGCPHAEARALWREALEVFGAEARELRFLARRAANDTIEAGA